MSGGEPRQLNDSDWFEGFDDENNLPFYVNSLTGESRWDPPDLDT